MDIYERLKSILLKMPRAKLASGGKEIVMQCQECGDSKRDMHAAHMYVKLPINEGDIPVYHCFRGNCGASGIITHTKLMQWGAYDVDTAVELTKYNKYALSLEKNRKFKDSDVYVINNTKITDNELTKIKLKYINNRLGTNLTYSDILSKKIVLNIKDLLVENNIQKLTRYPEIVDQLDESFVGFISQDNAFVNMRNLRPGKVHETIDKKYVNYNIFNKFDNTQRYYTLPASIDLNNPERIKLYIAEGAFDILSIYYNLIKNDYHSIFSAILGSSYMSICKHFIITMGLINLEIHVYADNDIENWILNELAQYLAIYSIPFYVHRNIFPGEKDFGVRIDRISDQVRKLV